MQQNFVKAGAGLLVVGCLSAVQLQLLPAARGAAALLQLIIVLISAYVAYEMANVSARKAAEDVIRPHARSAFRRVVSLAAALTRFINSIENRRERLQQEAETSKGMVSFTSVEDALALIAAQITEQLDAAGAAVEDWQDIVPEEVKQLQSWVRGRNGH